VKAIASSPHFGELESLDLRGNPIGDLGLQALAAFPHLSRLRELNLAECEIGNDGLLALLRTKHLPRLTRLFLSHNPITLSGEEIDATPLGSRLRYIRM